MKQMAIKLIERDEPVWFGCDVGKMMNRQDGLWDANLFEYGAVYDAPFDLDKAGRLEYHNTVMTHAMLFTGVDVLEGRPRRWRVENSWGEENGKKGFYTMNDNWFDEYMYEIACPRSLLSAELQEAAKSEPIVLPPWDPMGAPGASVVSSTACVTGQLCATCRTLPARRHSRAGGNPLHRWGHRQRRIGSPPARG